MFVLYCSYVYQKEGKLMATKKAATSNKASTAKKTASTKTTKSTRTVSAPATASAVAITPSFSESIKQLSFWRSLGAELVGTFLLAAVIIVGQGQPLYTLFALVGIVLFVGTISGAYVNPALVIAAWITRRISWIRAVGYIVFQVIGALLALLVLNAFIGGAASDPSTLSAAPAVFQASPLVEGKEWFVFFAEVLGTLILGFAVANALRDRQERLTQAFTVGLGIFIALMISFIAASYVSATAILNPAVAFSLQAITWNVWPIAVYILGPIVGGALGFFLNDLLKGRAVK